jgi:uncharacterized membrane protein
MTRGVAVSDRRGRRLGLLVASLAIGGAAIAAYLTIVKLAGALPACGPLHGCETVATSSYSTVLGIPVALAGLGLSLVIATAAFAWWWRGARIALLGAYAMGLAGVVVVAALTFLELFVIHAVCVWCATYAGTMIAGWLTTAWQLRRA